MEIPCRSVFPEMALFTDLHPFISTLDQPIPILRCLACCLHSYSSELFFRSRSPLSWSVTSLISRTWSLAATVMSDPADTDALQNVNSNLLKVKNAIIGLNSSLDEDDSLLDLKESAQLNVGLAFALGSLYFVLLNCKGAGQSSTGTLPVNGELDRIKEYVQRIGKMNKVPEVRKLTVDSEAAARIVKHNLDLVGGDVKKRKMNE